MKEPSDPVEHLSPVDHRPGLPAFRRIAGLVAMLRAGVRPVPLEPPEIHANLTALSAIERSAEVLRYSTGRLEYWLSPGGRLRAWFKLNLLLALFLAVPAVLVAPVVTFSLATVATWSQYLLTAAVNTLLTLITGVGIVAIVTAVWSLLRSLLR